VVESSTAIDAAPSKFKVSNINQVSCHHETFEMPSAITYLAHHELESESIIYLLSAWLPSAQAMCALARNTYVCADTQDMSKKHADKATASLSVHAV